MNSVDGGSREDGWRHLLTGSVRGGERLAIVITLVVTFRRALFAQLVSSAVQYVISDTKVICDLRRSALATVSHQTYGVVDLVGGRNMQLSLSIRY